MFRRKHASVRATVPTTLTLIVRKHAWNYLTTSTLWDSHQSTFGLPVYDQQEIIILYKSSGINNIVRLVLIQFSAYILRILQSGFSSVDRESAILQKLNYLPSNPTVFSEYQKRFLDVTKRMILLTILLLINWLENDYSKSWNSSYLGHTSSINLDHSISMHGNKYDTDVTVWSPEGKLHQVGNFAFMV